jgi:hypothetical protein
MSNRQGRSCRSRTLKDAFKNGLASLTGSLRSGLFGIHAVLSLTRCSKKKLTTLPTFRGTKNLHTRDSTSRPSMTLRQRNRKQQKEPENLAHSLLSSTEDSFKGDPITNEHPWVKMNIRQYLFEAYWIVEDFVKLIIYIAYNVVSAAGVKSRVDR